MPRKPEETERGSDPTREGNGEDAYRVEDRRHWTRGESETAGDGGTGEGGEHDAGGAGPRKPSLIEEYRQRTEAAESKLLEYIEAYKRHQAEQDDFRARLAQDIDRKVDLKFGSLVEALLQTVDDLDRALSHVASSHETASLARGVAMARDRFLSVLASHGVTPLVLDDVPFDPNEAEAVRIDPVDDPTRHNFVTETLQPGYRLGERILRPARVAVGRHVP
jgi:molecular chaperone GrpE (heat shock protein)